MDHSLARVVASTVLTGIPGARLAAGTHRFLARIKPAGFIIFSRNYAGDPSELRALCDQLHKLDPNLPPVIAIDHEGGRVQRLGAPFTHFPAPQRLGKTPSATLTLRIGIAMGRELRAAGIDMNFAPVLDVNSNPNNPVIGDRAFAATPTVVARLGTALARGLNQGGVLACAKHFPGHGDTTLDSHYTLPTVAVPRSMLNRRELVPFRRAIAAGIPAIMSAHVLYPALDPDRPATLSSSVLSGLLRRALGFRGALITDDLAMGALGGPLTDSAVAALAAGADALLLGHDFDRLEETIEAVVRAVERREISRARLAAAERRMVELRRLAARLARNAPPLAVIGSDPHLRVAQQAGS